jgi:hypothetical protein
MIPRNGTYGRRLGAQTRQLLVNRLLVDVLAREMDLGMTFGAIAKWCYAGFNARE